MLVFIIVDDWDCVVLVGCCVSLIDVVDPSVATVVVGCCVPLTVVEDGGSWGARVVVEYCCVELGDVGVIGCCVPFVKGVDCCGPTDVEVVSG